jgi:hypothetical protein
VHKVFSFLWGWGLAASTNRKEGIQEEEADESPNYCGMVVYYCTVMQMAL